MSLGTVYSSRVLQPTLGGMLAVRRSARIQAGLTILAGTLLGEVITGVNAVQTITIGSTPTNYILNLDGYDSAEIAYNISSANLQTILAAMPNVGAGNVSVSGSAAGPYTVTFQGALANQPIVTMYVSNSITGGTVSIAATTVGVIAGGLKAADGTVLAPLAAPSVSAVSGGTIYGDGTNVALMLCQTTLVTAGGESLPSPVSTVVVTSSNRTIRFAAISSLAASVTAVRYYVNGILQGETAAAALAVAQTDLTGNYASPKSLPEVNTAFSALDGSYKIVAIAEHDMVTDAEGGITVGQNDLGALPGKIQNIEVFCAGYFDIPTYESRPGVTGIVTALRSQLRLVKGSWTTGVIALGL